MGEDSPRWSAKTVPATPSSGERSAPASVSPFDPPANDRFEEGAELGRGGMGRVFEARDVALDRPVAIKQSLGDDPQLLIRFEREVRITAQLQHPGIVPVLDAGRDREGRPYYVMRKIEGRPLATVVGEARAIRERLALLPNMLAAIDAVAYAHARGVIHRDLKPWNILLGPFGETFVIDWGLARDLAGDDATGESTSSPDHGLTRIGSALGTPGFMPPEQARGEALDRRADVYALGATLVHVLLGQSPFAGIEPTQAIERVARDEAPAITFPDEVPAELVAIATKAMVPARTERYADARELAADLRRFLAGQLVAAHEYTFGERIAKWLRKHRLVVAIATVALIALVVISTLAIRRVVVARDAEREARAHEADRADDNLVERAYAVATTEPAHAIALLAHLPEASRKWERAHVVAETAAAAGIGRGMPLTKPGAWGRVVASPKGDVVAVTSEESLWFVDPSLTKPAQLMYRGTDTLSQLEWIDADTIVCVHTAKPPELVRIARDGSTRVLDIGGATSVQFLNPVADGRVFAILDGRLRELDPDGGVLRADLGPVKSAAHVEGGLLYQVDGRLVIHADGRAPVAVPGHMLDGARVAANLPSSRIAINYYNRVVELELGGTGWTERGTWEIDPSYLAYDRDRLVAVEGDGFSFLVPGKAPHRAPAAISRDGSVILGGFATSDAGMFAVGDRAIFLLGTTDVRAVPIAPFTDRVASFAKAGHYLVALHRTGTLRSWDLRQILPQTIRLPFASQLAHVDAERAWLISARGGGDKLYAVELATGNVGERIGDESIDQSSLVCSTPNHAIIRFDHRKRMAMKQPAWLEVLDLKTKTRARLAGSFEDAICSRYGRLLALTSKNTVEVRDARAPDRPGSSYEITAPVRGVAFVEKWLAIVDTAGGVTRIDLATGKRAPLAIGAFDALAIDSRGHIAAVKDGKLLVWSDPSATPHTAATDVTAASMVSHDVGFLVFTHSRELLVIDEQNRVVRYDVGDQATGLAIDALRLSMVSDGKLALLDLRDGSLIRYPWSAQLAQPSPDGNTIAAMPRVGDQVTIIRTRAPRDPAALRRWLATITNATIEPGSTAVTWRPL